MVIGLSLSFALLVSCIVTCPTNIPPIRMNRCTGRSWVLQHGQEFGWRWEKIKLQEDILNEFTPVEETPQAKEPIDMPKKQ
jgi:hypothetical protein